MAVAASPYGESQRQGGQGGSLGRSRQNEFGGQGLGQQGSGFGRQGGQSGLGGGRGGTFREGGIANSQSAGRHGNIGGYPGTHHGGYQSHGY